VRRLASAALLGAAAAGHLFACAPPSSPLPPSPPCPVASASAAPCAGREPAAYLPLPALSVSASLPDPLSLPERPERAGEAYTVWGLKKALRAPGGAGRLRDVDVTVEGYVASTNFDEAPPCALHPIERPDPPGCVGPVPSFSLADSVDDERFRLAVMGFASSWANLFTASARAGRKAPYLDSQWGRVILDPLPARGAKMRVTGRASRSFPLASGGVETRAGGVVAYLSAIYLVPPPAGAPLGPKRRGAEGR
jgi:hypothetical protein